MPYISLYGSFLCLGCGNYWIDGITMKEALFETASAIGTVGVTLGVTPFLRGYSHLILICLMFGRVGGLTLLLSLRESKAPDISRYPEEADNHWVRKDKK